MAYHFNIQQSQRRRINELQMQNHKCVSNARGVGKVNSSRKVHFLLTEACKTIDKLILQLLNLSYDYRYAAELKWLPVMCGNTQGASLLLMLQIERGNSLYANCLHCVTSPNDDVLSFYRQLAHNWVLWSKIEERPHTHKCKILCSKPDSLLF